MQCLVTGTKCGMPAWKREPCCVCRACAAYRVEEKEWAEVFEALRQRQIDLPDDAARILRDNLWDLYERTTSADDAVDPIVGAQHSPSTRD